MLLGLLNTFQRGMKEKETGERASHFLGPPREEMNMGGDRIGSVNDLNDISISLSWIVDRG